MNNRKLFRKVAIAATLTGAVALCLPATASAAPPRAKKAKVRHARQGARIHQGVKSGSLTPRETRALVKERRHIKRTQKRMLRDGRIDRFERARLNRMQSRASRHIYKLKHNGHGHVKPKAKPVIIFRW